MAYFFSHSLRIRIYDEKMRQQHKQTVFRFLFQRSELRLSNLTGFSPLGYIITFWIRFHKKCTVQCSQFSCFVWGWANSKKKLYEKKIERIYLNFINKFWSLFIFISHKTSNSVFLRNGFLPNDLFGENFFTCSQLVDWWFVNDFKWLIFIQNIFMEGDQNPPSTDTYLCFQPRSNYVLSRCIYLIPSFENFFLEKKRTINKKSWVLLLGATERY